MVTDPNVSRIMLMILRDFVYREAVYARAEDEQTKFSCPIMKCYEDFDQPMGLIGHLLECKQLRFGEFNCVRCKAWHRYPITEREWLKWEGWQAEAAPAISFKKRLSEITDSIGRVIRSPRRSSAPSSQGGSPTTAVKSPGPPDWTWSGAGESTLYDEMSPSTLQDQKKKRPAASESASELQAAVSELQAPWSPLTRIVVPAELPPSYPQSSAGGFLSGQNGGSPGGSSQSMSDTPGSPCGYSPSSLSSSQVTARQLQVSAQQSPVKCFDDITQSTEGMRVPQAARQPVWQPMPTPGYAGEAASSVNTFLTYPGSQIPTADYNPVSAISQALASNGVNTWNPQDGSLFSWLHDQMPPPQELDAGYVDVPQDTIAATNVGAVDPYLPVPGRIPVYHGLDPAGRASDYNCETCGWHPRKTGKVKNFANYLRKHRKNVHSGQRFDCPNPSCWRSYSRQDNLAKHIRDSHPGSLGGPNGFPSSFQTRSANKRRSNR